MSFESFTEFSKCQCVVCIRTQAIPDGWSGDNERVPANLVQCHGTISDNFEEDYIPSLQVTDVDGTIKSLMYCGKDHTVSCKLM